MVLFQKSGNTPSASHTSQIAHSNGKENAKDDRQQSSVCASAKKSKVVPKRRISANDIDDDDDDFQTLITPRLLSDRQRKRHKKSIISQSALQESHKLTATKSTSGATTSPTYIKHEKQPVFEIEDFENIDFKQEQRPNTTFEIDDFSNDSDQEREQRQHLVSVESVTAKDDNSVVKQEATVFEIDDDIFDLSDEHGENNIPSHSRRLISTSDDDNDIRASPLLSPRMNKPLVEDEECPLCFQRFPQSIIRDHASDCVGIPSTPEDEPPLPTRQDDTLDINSRRHHRISRQSQLPPAYQPQRRSQGTNRQIGLRDDDQDTTPSQEYRTCPICNDWILISDLETHVNMELEGIEQQQDQQRQQQDPSLSPSLQSNDPIPVSDTESDGSVIDISNEPAEIDEDDGYLSPLEGFVSVQERRSQDPEFERYFEQVPIETTASTSQRRRRQQQNPSNRRPTRYRGFNRRQYFANKARRAKR